MAAATPVQASCTVAVAAAVTSIVVPRTVSTVTPPPVSPWVNTPYRRVVGSGAAPFGVAAVRLVGGSLQVRSSEKSSGLAPASVSACSNCVPSRAWTWAMDGSLPPLTPSTVANSASSLTRRSPTKSDPACRSPPTSGSLPSRLAALSPSSISTRNASSPSPMVPKSRSSVANAADRSSAVGACSRLRGSVALTGCVVL